MDTYAETYEVELMKKALSESVCIVTFNKLNGDERVMSCTTNTKLMSKHMIPKGTSALVPSDHVIKAYDTTADGWRSFRVESVTNFTVDRTNYGNE